MNKHIYCSFVINISSPADLYGEAIVCSVEKESCSSNFLLRLLPGPQCVSKAMAGVFWPCPSFYHVQRVSVTGSDRESAQKRGGGLLNSRGQASI